VSLSNDNTLRINDLKYGRGKLLKKLNESYVKLAISPDGKKLALASGSGKLIVLDMKNADQENVILPAGGPIIRSITFSPAGDKVVVGNTHGIVKMIDLSIAPWLVFTELRGHNTDTHITDVVFSEDGTFFASGGFDGTILLWNMNNLNKLPVIIRDNSAQVWSLSFSHDSDYLYAGCEDGSIKVWPTRTESMSSQLVSKLSRNMTREEWLRYAYVDRNISYAQILSSVNP
jgi:WD40 repeat protein